MKDFDSWNDFKKVINRSIHRPFYRERQIFWCNLGVNVGFEQDGTGKGFSRPVLILRGFSKDVCLIVPLTTSINKNKYLFRIGKIKDKNAQVIISQLKLIDTRRLDQYITTLDKLTFSKIKKSIKDLL